MSRIDSKIEEIKNGKWMPRELKRLRQLTKQALAKELEQLEIPVPPMSIEQAICEIGGDQTLYTNVNVLASRLDSIETKLIDMEFTTGDEATRKELKRIKNDIDTLRAEGFSVPYGATYIPGIPTDFVGEKPDISVYAQGYGADIHGELQNEIKTVLKDWFKDQREELELEDEEPIEVVDSGFAETVKDPAKCREPIFNKKKKLWGQCSNYKLEGSDYCHKHQKTKEQREKLRARW